MLRLLLTALLAPQNADLDRLVEDLGAESLEVRERATDLLESRGAAVTPTLQTALRHDDLEVRCRARDILFRLEPSFLLEELKKSQRPAQTPLLAEPRDDGPDRRRVEVGIFRFERRFWMEKGIVTGTILTTTWEPPGEASVRWTAEAVLAGCEIPVERCSLHSPHLLFVPAETTDPCRIRISGTRSWTCRVPVTFRNPKMGDVRRIGPYTVTLQWPSLRVSADPGMRADGIMPSFFGEAVDCRLKSGRTGPTGIRWLTTWRSRPSTFRRFPRGAARAPGAGARVRAKTRRPSGRSSAGPESPSGPAGGRITRSATSSRSP
jgi:hypothetical protein